MAALERSFDRRRYVTGRDRTTLARALQLTDTQVKIWFQNHRYKTKRRSRLQQLDGVMTSRCPDDVIAPGVALPVRSPPCCDPDEFGSRPHYPTPMICAPWTLIQRDLSR